MSTVALRLRPRRALDALTTRARMCRLSALIHPRTLARTSTSSCSAGRISDGNSMSLTEQGVLLCTIIDVVSVVCLYAS